jgi:hypothetical protein
LVGNRNPFRLEALIAKAIARFGPCSASEITEYLYSGDPELRTKLSKVAVTLKRMEKKGLVLRGEKSPKGIPYSLKAEVSEESEVGELKAPSTEVFVEKEERAAVKRVPAGERVQRIEAKETVTRVTEISVTDEPQLSLKKKVLEEVKKGGEISAVDIAERLFGSSDKNKTSAVTVNLHRLENEGYIESEKSGRRRIFKLREIEIEPETGARKPAKPKLKQLEGLEGAVYKQIKLGGKASASEIAKSLNESATKADTNKVCVTIQRLEEKGLLFEAGTKGRKTYYTAQKPLLPRIEAPEIKLPKISAPHIPPMYAATGLSLVIAAVIFFNFTGGMGFFAMPSQVLSLTMEQQQLGGLQNFVYGVKNVNSHAVQNVVIEALLPPGSNLTDYGGAEISQRNGMTVLTWLVSQIEPNERHMFSFSGKVPGEMKLYAAGLSEQEQINQQIIDKPTQARLTAGEYGYRTLEIEPIGYLGELAISLSAGPEGTNFTEETVPIGEIPITKVTENITTIEVNETEPVEQPIENITEPEQPTENVTPPVTPPVENVTPPVTPPVEPPTENVTPPAENITSPELPSTGGIVTPPEEVVPPAPPEPPKPKSTIKIYLDPDTEMNGNEDLIGEAGLSGEWNGTLRVSLPAKKYNSSLNLVFYSDNGATVLVKGLDLKWVVEVPVNSSETFLAQLYENLTENLTQNLTQNVTQNLTDVIVSILDSAGAAVDADVTLTDSKGSETNESAVAAKGLFEQVSELMGGKKKAEHKFKAEAGEKKIDVKPKAMPIKELSFSGVKNSNITLGLDGVPTDTVGPFGFTNWSDAYAIDPTKMNFTSATVTAVASGTQLYKCKDWNFTEQKCYGEWAMIMELTPGQDYTFTLTPDDPAYFTYNYTTRATFGHQAYRHASAGQPPSTGPYVTGSIELDSYNYSLVSASDNREANQSLTSGNSGVFMFMWHLNFSRNKIVNLTGGVEGYSSGTGSRPDKLHLWNWTKAAWVEFVSSSPTADYNFAFIINESSVQHFVNGSSYVAVAFENDPPTNAQTLFVDFANITLWADMDAPDWFSQAQNSSTPLEDAAVLLSVNWKDDTNETNGNATLATNETGAWVNKTTYGSPDRLSGTNGWSNFTWQNASTASGTVVGWCVYANDSYDNWNVTDIMTFTVSAGDTTPPLWSANTSSIPNNYSTTNSTKFNVSWVDAESAVSYSLIEGNWSGVATNYTMFQYNSTLFGYNDTLPAGTFYWKSWANDTAPVPNWNSSDTIQFQIYNASNIVNLYFNNSTAYANQDITVTFGTQTNATANTSKVTASLYRNEVAVTNPNILLLGGGTYTYKANATGNTNYTYNSTGASYTITVNQASSPLTFLLNGTLQNYTCSYPCTANITGLGYNATTWRNNTNVSSENKTAVKLAAGYYEYTLNTSTTQNRTSNTTWFYLNISKGVTQTRLYLNNTEGNKAYYKNNVANFTVTVNATGETVYLNTNITGWIENTTTTPLKNMTRLLTNGVYNITGWFEGDENYTASSQTYYATVTTSPYLRQDTAWNSTMTGVEFGASAWGDINKDGYMDVVICGYDNADYGGNCEVYMNSGTTLVQNATWGGDIIDRGSGSVVLGDVNGDGWLDLFASGFAHVHPSNYYDVHIYINNGTAFHLDDMWTGDATPVADSGAMFGDVDNDGDLDLALTGKDSNTDPSAQLLINNGTSFVDSAQWGQNLVPVDGAVDVFWADLNRDGKLDLVTQGYNGTAGPDMFNVYINNGTTLNRNKTWESGVTGTELGSLWAGDIDADGYTDVLEFGDAYPGPVKTAVAFRNTGSGFTEQTAWDANLNGINGGGNIGGADINNDGRYDIMTSGWNGAMRLTGIYLWDGTTFTYNALYSQNLTNVSSTSLTWVDVDNDSVVDLLVTGYTGNGWMAQVYSQHSDAPNAKPNAPTTLTTSYSNGNLSLGWDGATDNETASISLTYNLRIGTTSERSTARVRELTGNDIMAGDLGGNGRVDNQRQGNMRSMENFTLKGKDRDYYWAVQAIDTGLAQGNWSVEQYYDSPGDKFKYNASYSDGLYGVQNGAAAFGDIDNDGDLDMIQTGQKPSTFWGKTLVYINNGTGLNEDSAWEENLTDVDYSSLALCDLDNNGRLELLLMGWRNSILNFNNTIEAYSNNGTAFIKNSTLGGDFVTAMINGSIMGDIECADINNDGLLDVGFQGSNYSNAGITTAIFINNGTALKSNSTWGGKLIQAYAGAFKFGDLNGDGRLDAVQNGWVEPGVNQVSVVYINNGTALLPNTTWNATMRSMREGGVALGDLNGDGRLDAVMNGWDQDLSKVYTDVYINSGTSLVLNTSWLPVVNRSEDGTVVLGDVNNDGLLDLALAGYNTTHVLGGKRVDEAGIYLNNGSALVYDYNYSKNLHGVAGMGYINLADLDNDGALDAMVSGYNGVDGELFHTEIYRNRLVNNQPNTAPTAPTEFSSSYSAGRLNLTWSGATDSEGGTLYYNLRVGTCSGCNDIMTGTYGYNGRHESQQFGNMRQRTSVNLTLPQTEYYWAVQAIDAGYRNGTWSAEQLYSMVPAPKYTVSGSNTTAPEAYAAVELYANWTGGSWAWLETNETGDWADKSDTYAAIDVSTGGWSNFTWQNNSLDGDTVVGWRINANSTGGTENVTAIGVFTTGSSVSITLTASAVNLGALSIGSTNKTSGDSPLPFRLRNDGNVKVNITINGTNMWLQEANPTANYRYAANTTEEGTTYNTVCSDTAWTNMPAWTAPRMFLCYLGWLSGEDEAEAEIAVQVPIGEPTGAKSGTVTFIASQA